MRRLAVSSHHGSSGAHHVPRFSPVHFSFGGRLAERITELSWTLNTSGPRLNLGLVTAELRAVARDQLPTSRTPAHTLRFPLCDCYSLFGKVHNPSVIRVGPVQLVPNTEFGNPFPHRHQGEHYTRDPIRL